MRVLVKFCFEHFVLTAPNSVRSSVPDLFVDTDLETLAVLWPSSTGRGTEASHSPAPQPSLYLLDMKTASAPV